MIDLHAAIGTHLVIVRSHYIPVALQHGESAPFHQFTGEVEPVVRCLLVILLGLVPRVASHLSILDSESIQVIILYIMLAMIMTTRSVHDHVLEARWFPSTQLVLWAHECVIPVYFILSWQ